MILKAYKFRLKTSPGQAAQCAHIASVCRLVWNLCLGQRVMVYNSRRQSINAYKQLLEVTQLRREYDWIKAVPAQALQQAIRDLDAAYANFFAGRAAFPEFKKKGRSRVAFRFPQGIKVDGRRIFLPKIGWVGFFKSQEIAGEIRHATVSRTGRHWFVSLTCTVEIEEPVRQSGEVGIDMGIVKLCALSDGTIHENPDCLKRHQARLAMLQRRLAHKTKFSKNFYKAKAKITALHTKIADTRRDFIHKTTTTIAKSHGLVVIEDLRVKAMSGSARGTVESPGRRVRQKAGLNRGILDAGWGEFRRQLEYKLAWSGGILVAVDPRNTSRACPVCGHIAPDNRPTQAEFRCVACGHEDDADINAAINILRAGHARLACGENGAPRPLCEAGTLKAA